MAIFPKTLEKSLKKIFLHNLGMCLFLLGFFGLGAILSHSSSDMSLNTASNTTINGISSFGAYYSDIVLQVFGIAGVAVTLTFMTWGYKLVRFGVLYNISFRFWILIVAILFICVGTAPFNSQLTANSTMQGIIGEFLSNISIKYLNQYDIIAGIILVLFSIPLFLYAVAIDKKEWRYTYKQSKRGVGITSNILKSSFLFILKIIRKQQTQAIQSEPSTTELTLPERSVWGENIPKPNIEPKQPLKTRTRTRVQKTKSEEGFQLPPSRLLVDVKTEVNNVCKDEQEQSARQLERILGEFGVKGEIVGVRTGPVVTTFELEPAAGVRSSRIISLTDDIARTMGAQSVRIAPIPGKTVIGIEMPNNVRETVAFKDLIVSKLFNNSDMILPLILGKDIEGGETLADLAAMPHLLIAGTTGSGKSVGLNGMIISLLFRYTPDELKMIMVDPKMLEFAMYEDIPHLISPVVTDPKKAVVALKWAVNEMNNRYSSMSKMSVRNIEGYNKTVEDLFKSGEVLTETVQMGFDEQGQPIFEEKPKELKKYPYLIIIIDEMADLMLVAGKDIEASIQSLAQKARAAGIHLIMATQRPSVDVITGIIKANFPTRISYMVTSKIDSRTIINEGGAEQLLGRGDMLYMASGSKLTRNHAPFVQDQEVKAVCDWLRAQAKPEYEGAVTTDIDSISNVSGISGSERSSGDDEMYDEAVALVAKTRKASTSYIQRALKIGYNRAANIIEKMEAEGVVSSANKVGKRDILVPEKEY